MVVWVSLCVCVYDVCVNELSFQFSILGKWIIIVYVNYGDNGDK